MKRYRTYRFLPGKFNKWLPTTVRYKLIRFIGLGHFSAYAVEFFHGSERSLPINGSFLLTSLSLRLKCSSEGESKLYIHHFMDSQK